MFRSPKILLYSPSFGTSEPDTVQYCTVSIVFFITVVHPRTDRDKALTRTHEPRMAGGGTPSPAPPSGRHGRRSPTPRRAARPGRDVGPRTPDASSHRLVMALLTCFVYAEQLFDVPTCRSCPSQRPLPSRIASRGAPQPGGHGTSAMATLTCAGHHARRALAAWPRPRPFRTMTKDIILLFSTISPSPPLPVPEGSSKFLYLHFVQGGVGMSDASRAGHHLLFPDARRVTSPTDTGPGPAPTDTGPGPAPFYCNALSPPPPVPEGSSKILYLHFVQGGVGMSDASRAGHHLLFPDARRVTSPTDTGPGPAPTDTGPGPAPFYCNALSPPPPVPEGSSKILYLHFVQGGVGMSDASRAGYRLLPPDVAIITNIQHCNTDNLNLCSPNRARATVTVT